MRAGQSLIEVLVAVAVGVIMIAGAAAIIAPSLRTADTVKNMQVAGALGKELYENVRSVAESNWHNIDFLATSSANIYHLSTSSSPFSVAAGLETIAVGTSTYSRYFYLDDVYRNSSKKIDSAGTFLDPSTKKLTVVYQWSVASSTMVDYLTRSAQNIWVATDWSYGASTTVVTATSSGSFFSTSSSINYTTTTAGSIVVQGY